MAILATYSILLIFAGFSCKSQSNQTDIDEAMVANMSIKSPTNELSIIDRYPTPQGYRRVEASPNTFAEYLRSLPLKPENSPVLYYDGTFKRNESVYSAVIDLPIGNKNLHQCADAVMRLRAEYLWNNNQFEDIHFNFTNGFRVDYMQWMQGKRMVVNGNQTYWDEGTNSPSTEYESFWKYLELIFTYAGTASLENEMHPIDFENLQIGDVLIQGGYPGHAVIVIDMCIDSITQQKMFLLAQSYMPAQELQILINPKSEIKSSWYPLQEGTIETPEWTFYDDNARRF